jgi:oligopeptide/dipeptide ABC transporter ATP-binding protein
VSAMTGPDARVAHQPSGASLLRVDGLVRHFRAGGGWIGRGGTVHAVDGVDLEVQPGEVFAVVGESGSGKSTLGRCMLGLLAPTAGRIWFDGVDVTRPRDRARSGFRRRVQPVFQDPFSSLDPRWTVARTVREPLDAFGVGTPRERDERVEALLDRVGLAVRQAQARPAELSGGQRQRVAIAAALALQPELIVADEPVSALDVLVRAQILNLFAELRRTLGLAIVLITHDLSVVEHMADRVAVMYLGRIVETGTAEQVLSAPLHPYTRALVEAIPYPDPERRLRPPSLRGEIPSPLAPPPGCRFHPRCPVAIAICSSEQPPPTDFGGGSFAACHVAAAHKPRT